MNYFTFKIKNEDGHPNAYLGVGAETAEGAIAAAKVLTKSRYGTSQALGEGTENFRSGLGFMTEWDTQLWGPIENFNWTINA